MREIIYYAADETMGDMSHEECNGFRSWALGQLLEEYPTHQITVSGSPSLVTVYTDDEALRDEIQDYCSRLWDRY